MKGAYVTCCIICMILFSSWSSLVGSQELKVTDSDGDDKSIFVDGANTHGPWDGSQTNPYRRIQDAIDASDPYASISIGSGIYHERLSIIKPISLFGQSHTIVDASYQGSAVELWADTVFIHQIGFRNSGGNTKDAGITAQGHTIYLEDCVFFRLKSGVFLRNITNVTLHNCSFYHVGQGLNAYNVTHLTIDHCYFRKNAMGLTMQHTHDIEITRSAFEGNGMSIYGEDLTSFSFSACNVSDNSVNKGGLFLINCSHGIIIDSLFEHNGVGISFSSCDRVNVSFCDFLSNTHFSISFRDPSKNIQITQSCLSDGLRSGVYIEKGTECIISKCNIVNNLLYGLKSTDRLCNARYNWWGSSLGPYLYCLFYNKLSPFLSGAQVYPWEKSEIQTAGVRNVSISKCPCNDSWITDQHRIFLEGLDSDDDQVPDWWETKWGYDPTVWDDHYSLDPDGDALNNVEECYTDGFDSNPFRKDIFLEIDWMRCEEGQMNKPSWDYLQVLIDDFAAHNITLHVDIGNLGGGEEIEIDCEYATVYTGLHEIYWQYFLNNDTRNPRKGIFHYGLICRFCPDLNFPFIGWDDLDSFAISVEWLRQEHLIYDRQELIVGGIAHHLGHTLGLIVDDYEGIDNVNTLRVGTSQWFKYRSYVSCMNYWYKFRLFTFSDGSNGPGDFNDWENMELHFFKDSSFIRK